MGAYDSISADASCPRCGSTVGISDQTKFFAPDYADQVWFRPGIAQPKPDVGPDNVLSFGSDDWFPVRAHEGPYRHFALLADFDSLTSCSCELPLATIYHFDVEPGTVTLAGVELLDAHRLDIADHVDFMSGDGIGWLNYDYNHNAAVMLAAPQPARAALLCSWLAARLDAEAPGPHYSSQTRADLAGETVCEACGDTRPRATHALFGHADFPVSFFGTDWTNGMIKIGETVPFDASWLADDVDRGYYVRLHHPIGASITIVSEHHHYSCACGVRRPFTIARFARTVAGIELVSLSLREIRGRDDLADIDFVEALSKRWSRPAMTREQIIDELISRSRTGATARY